MIAWGRLMLAFVYRVTVPDGVILPMALAWRAVNQRLPSGPATMSFGP